MKFILFLIAALSVGYTYGQTSNAPVPPADSTVATSAVAFIIPEKDAHIESIAYDPSTRTFYLGAIHKRKILAVEPGGRISDFTREMQEGMYSVLGLRVDARRNVLWDCTTALPQMKGYSEADKNKTIVLRYDLTTRRLVQKYRLPEDGRPHVLGEPLVAANGDLYISDSGHPAIYRIRTGSSMIELFLDTNLRSLQGIAFSADEQRLFIADYLLGIHVCDVASRQLTKLGKPDALNDRGVDGLYVFGNRLIAIQNGVSPSRVVSFQLDNLQSQITAATVLEMNNPRFNEPTLGVLVGKRFYYVANSQWSSYYKDGSIFPPDRLADILIMQLMLN